MAKFHYVFNFSQGELKAVFKIICHNVVTALIYYTNYTINFEIKFTILTPL